MITEEQKEQLSDEVESAKQAKEIVNNPAYQKAITMIRGDLYNKFRQCGWKDDEERAEIWRKEQIVNWFEDTLSETIQTGKLAEQTLTQKVRKIVGL